MRIRDRRISQLRRAIESSPVQQHLLTEEYEWFLHFGELPDDDVVAYAVVLHAMGGGVDPSWADDALHPSRRPSLEQRVRDELTKLPPSVRAGLFFEALFKPEPIRRIARAQIAVEVAYGGDVANVAFGARHGIPMYGSVALHMAGYPRRYITAPYEDQGNRLLVRQDKLCGRIPQDDPEWFEAQAKAQAKAQAWFEQSGELPKDALHAEVVLLEAEWQQMAAHRNGKDVSRALALLDRVARRGDGSELALKELCAMVAAGDLR